MTPDPQTSMRLPEDLRVALKVLAAREHRTQNSMLVEAVQYLLMRYRRTHRRKKG